jgi:hypothetical protein
MSLHPALRRHSLLWWIVLIGFLVFGVPRVYDFVTRNTVQPPGELANGEKRKKAQGQIMAIQEALVAYRNQYGNYPRPVGGSNEPVTVAKMLYQAVTGDGTDMIHGAEQRASDGNPGTDGEFFLQAAFNPSGTSPFTHKDYYLMDPWGQPYHYVRGDEHAQTKNSRMFDLWTEATDQPGREDNEAVWISNWKP